MLCTAWASTEELMAILLQVRRSQYKYLFSQLYRTAELQALHQYLNPSALNSNLTGFTSASNLPSPLQY